MTDLYEYLIEEGQRLSPELFERCSELAEWSFVKKNFMETLYFKSVSDRGQNSVTELFSTVFPRINQFIEEILFFSGSMDFGYLLQRIEAYLILEVAGKAINEQLPEAPFFTIHDTILTNVYYEEQVKMIVKEAIENETGVALKLEGGEKYFSFSLDDAQVLYRYSK